MNGKEQRKVWILAGEASGDLYGARLAEELRKEAAGKGKELLLAGMGAAKMRAAGVSILVDSSELGVIGVVEVFRHIFTFIAIFFKLVRLAKKERPDAVILIDYPGFNLRFAKAMFRAKIPVIWYICPQVWVWAKWRIPTFAKVCSKMLVIFPFEVDVFKGTKLRPEFVGHPLIDIVEERRDPAIVRDPQSVLLLPGSRKLEITRLLVPMLEAVTSIAKERPDLKFHLAAPRERVEKMARAILEKFQKKHPDCPPIDISVGDTGQWLQRAGTGLAASGTITVESAVSGLPLVVCYKLGFGSLLLAGILVRHLYRGFFTMANIIANREVFQEFFQWHCNGRELKAALVKILPGGERRRLAEEGMALVRSELAGDRSLSAAARAAKACSEVLHL